MSDSTPVRYEAPRLSPADRLLLQQDRPSATAHYEHCPNCIPGYELQAVALHLMLQAVTIALAHEHAVSLVPRDDSYGIELVIHGRAGECECGPRQPGTP